MTLEHSFHQYKLSLNSNKMLQIALSIIGATLGPVVGVFVLGGLIPWANWIVRTSFILNFFSAKYSPFVEAFMLIRESIYNKLLNLQGALSGGLVSVTVTMWMLLGQTLHGTQTQSLPTTTEDCHLYKSIIKEIQLLLQSIELEILSSLGNKTNEYNEATTFSSVVGSNITAIGASTDDGSG